MYNVGMGIEGDDSWEMHNTVPAGIKKSLNTGSSIGLLLGEMYAEIRDGQEEAM